VLLDGRILGSVIQQARFFYYGTGYGFFLAPATVGRV
jgi:hypothetical protein